MGILAGTTFDPAAAATWNTTAASAMAAMDTTNLRLTFTAPASGRVMVHIGATISGATTTPSVLLGVLQGAVVRGRVTPMMPGSGAQAATTLVGIEAFFSVSALTPGTSYTWDAAYGVEAAVAATAIRAGGANDATAGNAYGGIVYEIWEA